jgi:hypothetical protein
MSELELERLGQLMEPEPGNPMEAGGVTNPAAVRGPDGHLYLFPRLVAEGNFSRIGIARVQFNEAGDPIGVERLGLALEPEADYERRSDSTGGCEDPRITFFEPLRHYVMTYTAHSSRGPRIAVAVSDDLFHWDVPDHSVFDGLGAACHRVVTVLLRTRSLDDPSVLLQLLTETEVACSSVMITRGAGCSLGIKAKDGSRRPRFGL